MSTSDADAGQPPSLLRVVRGEASAEELAALVAVLSTWAAARPAALAPRQRAPGWADRAAVLRLPLRGGPGGWRASGLPR